jgi:glycosyltransferase involved in cell wall biosynthesis
MNAAGAPRKVLFVHHGTGEGGAAVALMRLLRRLDRQRYAPIVACDYRKKNVREFFASTEARIIDIKVNPFAHTAFTWRWYKPRELAWLLWWSLCGYWQTRRALTRVVAAERPSIVHLNGLSLLMYAPCLHRTGVSVVQHIREPVNDGVFGVRKTLLQHIGERYADFLIIICRDNQKRFSTSIAHAAVIYDPVDLKAGNGNSAAAESAPTGKEPVVFFPGGSALGIKGLIPFLEALALLREEGVKFSAIIPSLDGEASARDEIRLQADDIIRRTGLESAIVRVPFVDDVARYYSACDVVVAPFIVPHFSLAVIEAGAMARPVVGSRMSVIEEVLEDGVNGVLAMPGDARDLANKIAYVLEHPAEAKAMAARGLRLAQEKFNPDKFGDTIMGIYDSLLRS